MLDGDRARPLGRAFADESFKESPSGGFYVLAAAVFEVTAHEEISDVMRGLFKRRRAAKLHWKEMGAAEQESVAKTVAGLAGFHVVAVGAPVPDRRQERARANCLRRLVSELHSFDVEELVLEARTFALNARDVQTVRGARFDLPRGNRFWASHVQGSQEPLLWVADIVAGAVRASKEGHPGCKNLLADCLYEINVKTDC